jgi:adenylate cyclase
MDRPFPAYNGDEAYVVVSYSHDDSSAVFPELIWLKELGFNIWYDEGIDAGTEWREQIGRAIKNASLFLYFVSPASVQSENCRKEVSLADKEHIPIVAIHLRDTDLPDGLDLTLSDRQAILKYEIPKQEYQQKLQSRISSYLDQPIIAPTIKKRKNTALILASMAGVAVLAFGLSFYNQQINMNDEAVSEQARSDAADEVADNSIVVLPFAALSSGEDDGYFADGLTEEIRNALAQMPELQVIARSSSYFFKGQEVPVHEIAARLGVAYVVEGSVQRDADRVRIRAQLNRTSDGFNLWSRSYDRTLDDVFAIQEDIAGNIAEALGVVLDDNARKIMRSAGIRDVKAFIAYQKGLEAFGMAHTQFPNLSAPLAKANEYFDLALEAAPGLTAARVMKADRAGHLLMEISEGLRREAYPGEAQDALVSLEEEYDLALRLAPPGNQRDILNVERAFFSDDWSHLPDLIQKAMQPSKCPQLNWGLEIAMMYGRAEQAAAKSLEVLECNPMDVVTTSLRAEAIFMAGDPVAALQVIEEAEDKGLSHPWFEDIRYWTLLAAGRVDDPALRGRGPKGSNILFNRQILWQALAGEPAIALQMAEEYWNRADANDFSSLILAAVLGDRDRANQLAARIDAYPGSAATLSGTYLCLCGATFDLEATPNYEARIKEAGFAWPPPKRIDYPTKTW